MSMTLEEAIVQIYGLKKYCEDMADSDESGSYVFDLDVQALDLALSALRPVSRERVEKVWEKCQHSRVCGTCKICVGGRYQQANFCAACGAPLTDEAVEMVMERMNKLYD